MIVWLTLVGTLHFGGFFPGVASAQTTENDSEKRYQELINRLDQVSSFDKDTPKAKLLEIEELVHKTIPAEGPAIVPHLAKKLQGATNERVARYLCLAMLEAGGLTAKDTSRLEEGLSEDELRRTIRLKGGAAGLATGFQALIEKRLQLFDEENTQAWDEFLNSREIKIRQGKVGRAKNECRVIATAMGQFHKDVGHWPGGKGSKRELLRIVSGTRVATVNETSTGNEYGYTDATHDDWYDAGLRNLDSTPLIDVLDNHLQKNQPLGMNQLAYSTNKNETLRWQGPYLPSIGMDPWGHPYVCNIDATYVGTNRVCVVISAGPNGYFETPPNPPANMQQPLGDDVWAVVHTR